MAGRSLQKMLTHVGVLTGHPAAFLILFAYAAAWEEGRAWTLDDALRAADIPIPDTG